MSDNLVKRLRWPDFGTETSERNLMISAAARIEAQADRITKLETALRNIEADCQSDCPPSYGAIKYAARAALEGKKDE